MYRHLCTLALFAVTGTAFALPAVAAQPTPAPPTPKPQSSAIPAPPVPVLPSVPNVAGGYAAPALRAPSPDIIGITQQPFVGITLDNAIGMALGRNPDLAVAQLNRRVAYYQIQSAQGAYDVRFAVEPSYQYSTTAPQNAFFAGPNFGPIVQTTSGISSSVDGTLPSGQQYNVTVQGSTIVNNTTIDAFNPYYPTIFSVSFTQPLSRNRADNAQRRAIELARIGAESSDAQTLAAVSSTIAQVEDTYWDLVAAWRDVAIQEEALKEALAQTQSNARLARQGAAAPIDVVQSNAQVYVFQDNVYAALQNVAALQNELKALLLSNPADGVWMANLVPTSPVLQLPQQPALDDLVTQALRDRPEMAQVRDARRSADVTLAYAQREIKPQVNLQMGYSSNGFAGQPTNPLGNSFALSSAQQLNAINALIAAVNKTLPANQQIPVLPPNNTPIPGYLTGGVDQSIKNLLSNKFPVYSAGVQVTLPIGNRTAKADVAIAQEQERAAQLQEVSLIQRITVEVRDALQGYTSAESRLIAARAAREASEEVLASEQRRFRNGQSTTFLILQRQVELADNRGRELQAQTALNKAVVELERASGAILHDNNVNLNTVGQGALAQ